MSFEGEEFNDPGLKSALKGAWGSEIAPARLKLKVQMAMAGEAFEQLPKKTAVQSFLTRPLNPWAILGALAALVAMVFGWNLVSDHLQHQRQLAAYQHAVRPALNDDVAHALAAQHDAALKKLVGGAATTAAFNPQAVREQLVKQSDQPVWVSDFTSKGWNYAGSEVASIEGAKAAQVLFTRGKDSVSIMSLPVGGGCSVSPDPMYEKTVADHPMVALVTGGEMFCLVGYCPDGSLTVNDLKALRDQFKGDISAVAMH